ncbi:uncharacterized protein LOC116001187 [Ipomoea triloba]|uniref:uncharacterized protein LOC116001187 n=1 Tax=Ipomoea triloba TaxID=35885 RepID=UPI00125DB231|nr:uncharacterized protein LOC116001187 [Ipomoea triloba]
MAVWVRLPDLPMEYFRYDTITAILDNVGKPLKLDRTTTVASKGRFTRSAVEVDLNKPLVSEVLAMNSVQLVEYEGLHVVYFNCGVVGHREQSCPDNKPTQTDTPNMDSNEAPTPEAEGNQNVASPSPTSPLWQVKPRYETWMLVTKKLRPVSEGKNPRQPRKEANSSVTSGNQFDALADMRETGSPPTNRSKADKNKSKPGPNHGTKGKSPVPSNLRTSSPRQLKRLLTRRTLVPLIPIASLLEAVGDVPVLHGEREEALEGVTGPTRGSMA